MSVCGSSVCYDSTKRGSRYRDLRGHAFGKLTVIDEDIRAGTTKIYWKTKCSCGSVKSIRGDLLTSGKTRSCGCMLQRGGRHNANFKDLSGMRFSRLQVMSHVKKSDVAGLRVSKKSGAVFDCLCDCGKTLLVRADKLKSGHTQSCGCLHHNSSKTRRLDKHPAFVDLTGQIFGRLRVVSMVSRDKKLLWNCLCSCGKSINVYPSNLGKANTTSCGCYHIEKISGKNSNFYNNALSDEDRNSPRRSCAVVKKRAHHANLIALRSANYVCKLSGERRYLRCHHIIPYSKSSELRFDPENLFVIDHRLHKLFHSVYGNDCSAEDLSIFVQVIESFPRNELENMLDLFSRRRLRSSFCFSYGENKDIIIGQFKERRAICLS